MPGRVGQPPVDLDRTAEVGRAGFVGGVVAQGDHQLGLQFLVHALCLAVQAGQLDAGALQGLEALRMHLAARPAASAVGLHAGRRQMVEDGFREDAAAAVGSTEEKDLHVLFLAMIIGDGAERLEPVPEPGSTPRPKWVDSR
ncbi:hypothetical protein D3C75_999250 [compost metagenome]